MFGYIVALKMLVAIGCLSQLLPTALNIIQLIKNRLDQLKLSEDIATKIKEKLDYLQMTIRKIEPHLKRVDDAEELQQFLLTYNKLTNHVLIFKKATSGQTYISVFRYQFAA